MAELEVETTVLEDAPVAVLHCRGDVDAHTCGALDDAIRAALARDLKHLVIDFTDVGFTASKGLGVLISARKAVADRGGALALLNPNGAVRGTIEVLGFDNVFSITSTVEEAREALGL
jgi:anti-anti-sigma factor